MNKQKITDITITVSLAVVFIAASSSIQFLLEVLPRYAKVYSQLGTALPIPTQILFALGHFVRTWLFLLVFLLAGVYALAIIWPLRSNNKRPIAFIYAMIAIFFVLLTAIGNLALTRPLRRLQKMGIISNLDLDELSQEIKVRRRAFSP